jgi:hypothetical protein
MTTLRGIAQPSDCLLTHMLLAYWRKLLVCVRGVSAIPHIYTSVLQALGGWDPTGRLEGDCRGIGAGLCTILNLNFREILFHALG